MKFHVVGLPHTQTTSEFNACAFTTKIINFCKIMEMLGHEVYLYAGEKNEAPCKELIACITEEERANAVGDTHYSFSSFNANLPHWHNFLNNVINEIDKRIEQKDFICLFGGYSHKRIAESYPNHISIEPGIGYPATFSKYRVFESYAWMHTVYAENKRLDQIDGEFFDDVIPGFFDISEFPLQIEKEDYYLYIGRMIDRKGYKIAQEVCKELGKKLILAGPGGADIQYGEYVGSVNPEQRAKLMGGATAIFAPTLYIEPFGYIVPEAQLCGTPSITTDWGGFVETNINGLTGYRCRTFSEFLQAAEDVKKLDPIKIRERAESLYSLEAIAPQYDRYFKRLFTLWDNGWYQK